MTTEELEQVKDGVLRDGRLAVRGGPPDDRFRQQSEQPVQIDARSIKAVPENRGWQDWMELNLAGFLPPQSRPWEEVVASAFCYKLQRADIQPEHVMLRQVVEDTQGVVFRPGKKREIDIIALGNEIIVFEVKSTADQDDIDDLADKVALLRHQQPGRQIEGVLVMLGAETDHRGLCQEKGLKLIP